MNHLELHLKLLRCQVKNHPQLMKEVVDDFTGFGTGDVFLTNANGAFSKEDLERIASFFNTVSDSMR